MTTATTTTPLQSTSVSVCLAHAASGVNAVPGALHWGPADLIAYGAGPAVFLYDQTAGRVRASLVVAAACESESGGGSSESSRSDLGRVCCVRWKGPDVAQDVGENASEPFAWAELASGTSKGAVVTWRVRVPTTRSERSDESSSSSCCCDLQWEQTSLLRVEGGEGITSLAWNEEFEEEGRGESTSTLVALAGTAATVWSRRRQQRESSSTSSSPWSLIQRLSVAPRLAHAISLSSLDVFTSGAEQSEKRKRLLVLGVGAVDGTTLLFLEKERRAASSPVNEGLLPLFSEVPAAAARGHGDWVRGVAFTSKSKRKKTTTSSKSGGLSSSSSASGSSSSSLLMATASNDRTVRVWELSLSRAPSGIKQAKNDVEVVDDDVTALAAPSSSSKPSASSSPLSARLVATLTGHDDWVLSVDWAPCVKHTDSSPLLLSVSADRSARLWSPAADGDELEVNDAADESENGNKLEVNDDAADESENGGDGLWLCDAVVGDAGSAAALGFCGGCFAPDGDGLAAAGPAGAVHVWRREGGRDDGGAAASLRRRWLARPSAGGHSDAVVDAAWSGPDGACLLTVSEDQTARMSTWLKSGNDDDENNRSDEKNKNPPPLWAEVARPQTHGHDFSCVAAVLSRPVDSSAPDQSVCYASGSEEKVIRVFDAPGAFFQTLAWARGETSDPSVSSPPSSCSFGATLPALGLSNKAVHVSSSAGEGGRENGDEGNEGGEAEKSMTPAELYPEGPDALPAAAPAPLSSRPVEAALAGGTLWPESVKLYGHGAELSALAATGGGGKRISVFASASAAKATRWAAIRLWRQQKSSTSSPWAAAGPPHECHSLTVTRLAFRESEGGGENAPPLLLASASRDRSFAVHEVVAEESEREAGEEDSKCISSGLRTLCHMKGAHARALTDCAWAPTLPSSSSPSSSSPAVLATASRDGGVKVWSIPLGEEEGAQEAKLLLELPRPANVPRLSRVPATALALARAAGKLLLAVGLGDGGVQLWCLLLSSDSSPSLSLAWSASAAERHAAAVRRLCFAPEWARFGGGRDRSDGDGSDGAGTASAPSSPARWLASAGEDGAVRVYQCCCDG